VNKLRFVLTAVVVLLVATSAIALAGQRTPAHAQNHARSHSSRVAHDRLGARQGAEQNAVDADNVQQGDQTTPDTANSRASEQNAVDADNVQQGDQTTPDTANSRASEEASAPEAPSSDTEQGQAGEPASGHQDPPGDANHECGGNCQE
jgi:hypothetical protein